MKKFCSIVGLSMVLLLAGCGNNGNDKATSSSSSQAGSSSVTSSSASSSVTTSSSAASSSATNGSSTASSASVSKNTSNLSDKQIGVMAVFLAFPDLIKGSDPVYYMPASQNVGKNALEKGYSYITDMSTDQLGYVFYQVNGSNVTIKNWVSGAKDVADGHFKVETVTIDRLVNDYYVNQGQKDEVNGDVAKLKSAQQHDNE
ncbi:hypothetical protein MOO44_08500 [Nicoliella spurrieriana]|uniref:Lreu-0056-like domain-containing protein n=1 Tax=Nicoliella spurrieriana TaxID=2925830 RepID=A0A976RSC2_9LACO|nr:hypothetical protein [Nicoliella spurrieriana]UQS86889.1 hypothetical protein MOO44_08500 [Nicoliella spurrieriana]